MLTEFVDEMVEDWRPEEYYEKVFYNLSKDRIKAVLNEKKPVPYEIEIQPCSKCNAFCNYCWGGSSFETYDKTRKLEDSLGKKENMDKVVDEVLGFERDGFKIEVIKFCGATGEPLMNPLTLYAINRLYGKKKLRLFSNGLLFGLNKDNDDYLSVLAKVGRINLSLDAGRTETLHEIKKGALKLGVRLEDILGCIKKLKKFSDGKTDVDVSYVICRDNFSEIEEAADKFYNSGANAMRLRVNFNDEDLPKIYGGEIADATDRMIERYNGTNFKICPAYSSEELRDKKMMEFSSKDSGFSCSITRFWASIGPDGKIYPCGHITLDGCESYGDLLKQSFSEIWDGGRREEVIKGLPEKKCDNCSPFSYCTNKTMTGFNNKKLYFIEAIYS